MRKLFIAHSPALTPLFLPLVRRLRHFSSPNTCETKAIYKERPRRGLLLFHPLEIQCTNAMPTHRIMRTTTTTITKVIQMTANTRSKQQKQKQLIKK